MFSTGIRISCSWPYGISRATNFITASTMHGIGHTHLSNGLFWECKEQSLAMRLAIISSYMYSHGPVVCIRNRLIVSIDGNLVVHWRGNVLKVTCKVLLEQLVFYQQFDQSVRIPEIDKTITKVDCIGKRRIQKIAFTLHNPFCMVNLGSEQ